MVTLRCMTMEDYPAVMALMQGVPGVALRDADAHNATARYLARNPGLSVVAEADGALRGCAMCGHDGRRGYLQHVVVLPAYRRQGIAAAMVEHCLAALEREGILKCHLEVFKTNAEAARYWQGQGWQVRQDIDRYSFIRAGGENA